jgi:large subunit ribosomal protein L17
MRHRIDKVRLSRTTSHRIAMMRNMVTSLIEAERIETTLAKAKQLKGLADRMITLGKEGSLAARRRALAVVRKKSAVSKLFTELATRFRDRAGGYTRLLKLGFRHGDGAPMAIVEYLGYAPKKVEAPKVKKKSKVPEEKTA